MEFMHKILKDVVESEIILLGLNSIKDFFPNFLRQFREVLENLKVMLDRPENF